MKNSILYSMRKIPYYLKWYSILNIIYFFIIGMEECVWIKDGIICKTLSSIISDRCIVICLLIICIAYYGKKLKYKKLRILIWIVLCSIACIICNTYISKDIKIEFNYVIYIIVHLIIICVSSIINSIIEK